LWDAAARSAGETLSGHGGRVLSQAVSRDGSTLYTASLDGTVLAWDLSQRRRFGRSFQASAGTEGDLFDPTPHVAISPNERILATGDAQGRVSLWDVASLRRLDEWQAIAGQVVSVDFSPDGRSVLVAGSAPGPDFTVTPYLRIESIDASHEVIRDFHPPASASWATFGPGGKTVAASFSVFHPDRPNDGGWAVWDAATGRPVMVKTDFPEGAYQVAFSPDGSRIALALEDQRPALEGEPPAADLGVVDVRSGKVERRIKVGSPAAVTVDYAPDGGTVAVGVRDGFVRFWDVTTGRRVGRAVKASDGFVIGVRFSPDGRLFVTTGTDGTTRLFDAATRRQVGSSLPGFDNQREFAEFSPDGSTIGVVYSNGRAFE
jgi:WD40 repeat protein